MRKGQVDISLYVGSGRVVWGSVLHVVGVAVISPLQWSGCHGLEYSTAGTFMSEMTLRLGDGGWGGGGPVVSLLCGLDRCLVLVCLMWRGETRRL